jgi:hypothetical protein
MCGCVSWASYLSFALFDFNDWHRGINKRPHPRMNRAIKPYFMKKILVAILTCCYIIGYHSPEHFRSVFARYVIRI